MKKNLRSKILLCVLAGGVLAANTAFAKEYTETISGANDSYGTGVKSSNGNGNYTYNFGGNDKLNVNDERFAIFINENNKNDVNEMVINTPLNIYLTNNTQIEATYGIYIGDSTGNNINGKVIDRSGGGIIKVSSDKRELNENSGTIVRGVNVQSGNGNIVKIGNATVIVNAIYDENFFADAVGLYVQRADNEIIMDGGTIEVTADVNDGTNTAKATGIEALNGSKITTTNRNTDIIVTATGENSSKSTAIGIAADLNNANVITGNGDITVTAFSDNYAYADGIQIYEASNLEKENGKIEAVAKGDGTLVAHGLYMEFGNSAVNLGLVDITAKTIGGSVEHGNWIDSIGVQTKDNSIVNINGGSITAEAYNSDGTTENEDAFVVAILSEGTSAVNVNQGTSNNVIVNGNIETRNDSVVKLNLNTINSELNGAIDDNSDNGTTLTLANGAEWNNSDRSNVTNVSMNGGIINQNTDKYIEIEKYSGIGEIVLTVGDNTSNGDIDVIAGRTYITSADEGSVINMSVNNNNFIGTTDSAQALANLNQIANEISYDDNDGHITGKVTIKEGLIMPEASGDLLFYEDNANGHTAGQGYVANVKQNSSTTTIDNIKNIAATAIVAWRQEDSTLSQRLGELRESDGGQGIWVRMSRGEFEYDGEYKNQYNFFQMGYGWAAGSWHYGAAVSHNDGQTTYTHGDGENRSTSLSLYGTWLGDKGHYADIVLKQGRLSNDFDIYTEAGYTSGDYDAWGTSLSGEYGMKVDLDGGWYVTPQAQLTLMRIGGEDYTTNNGIKVNQDSLESAVGRVGFEVGKRISDSGSIYAKASLLHDFAGSADTYLSLNGLTNSYHQDIGDTWCEAGFGFNYKTSENSYVYADVVKTFGGDVETPWQWNAGMRWTF